MKMRKLLRVFGLTSSTIAFLTLASSAFAQSSTSSASKGGTSSSLPGAGSTELTYLFFIVGVVLFVFGMLKLVGSYRD